MIWGPNRIGSYTELPMFKVKPYHWAWAMALGFVLLRVWFVGYVQLAADEAYYWEWSRHLDWSYYDQGPMLAWVIHAGTAMFGVNEWGVRSGALVSGLGVSACYIYLAHRLRHPILAPWLVLAVNVMLLFSVGGLLMMHDSLAAFYWCLGLVAAVRAIEDDGRWWMAVGVVGAAGVLSKYTAILLLPCLLLACASHPDLRTHLKRPWIWVGIGMGGLLAGYPILHWNIMHEWPSLKHVASLGGADGSRVSFISLPEFLASQFALVTPGLFLLVLAAWIWAWKKRQETDASGSIRWLLWCCSAPVFIFFLLLSLRSRVEGNWPAPAYLAALPLAYLHLADFGQVTAKASRWAVGIAAALTLIVFSQAALGWLPLPKAEAARVDATFRVQGWRELAAQVAQERSALGPKTFVGCRTYQNAAELGFYLPEHTRPLILQKGLINHQYRFWNKPDDFIGRDAILVIGQEWELNEMKEMFASVEARPDHIDFRRAVLMRRNLLYIGRNFKGIP